MQELSSHADDLQAYARALGNQGEAALRAGDPAHALPLFEEAVTRWRTLDDATSLAQALNNLAVTYANLRQFQRAVPLLEEAIALLAATGNWADEAIARNALGNIHADLGDFPRAIALLESALPLRREAGSWDGLALTLSCLARIHDQAGDRLQALAYRRQAYAAAGMRDNPAAEVAALLELARAAAALGYSSEAEGHFGQAAATYARIGDTKGQGTALLAQAEARFEAGDYEGAVTIAELAFPLIRGTDAWTEMATQLEHLAHTLRFTGQMQGVMQSWKRGSGPNVDRLRDTVEQSLADEPGAAPIRDLLDRFSGMLNTLGTLPRPAPAAPEPTADEQAAADTRSVTELLAALQHAEQRERRIAALALGLRGDPQAVEPLIAATRDRSQWVRLAAVRALGKLRDARALEAIAQRLREDRDKEVRRSAATALRLLDDPRAVEALTAGLTDNSWRVAQAAEKSLRKLKAVPRVDVLIDLLGSGDAGRSCRAGARLAELGDQAAVEPLLAVAENPQAQERVRVEALDAAAKLGARRAANVAQRILQDPRSGARQRTMGEDTQALLICRVAEVIAQVGDARSVPVLLPHLGDKNPSVRYAVIRALGAVGDVSVIPALEGIQQRDHATVPADMSGMRYVRLRNVAAEAIAAIRAREAQR